MKYKETKSEAIRVRVTENELKKIDYGCALLRKTRSQFIRDSLRFYLDQTCRVNEEIFNGICTTKLKQP